MQAKDIDSDEFVAMVDRFEREHGRWMLIWDVMERHPDWPVKVIRAKADKLIRQRRIDGCACGCRGDFTVTDVVTGERLG